MTAENDYLDETPQEQAETQRETDEKCPACGAPMIFDPATGKLLCEYCGTIKEIENSEPKIAEEIDIEKAEFLSNHDWGTATKSVICKSCGAESVYDALKIADVCPYCGSNLVVEAGAEDAMAPNGVCAFGITAEKAAENFTKWIKKRIFAPKIVRKSAKADSFNGVYLPYWTFDTNTHSTYTARYGIDHTVRDRNGNTRTVTNWHSTAGIYDRFFDDFLISGTNRYDKKIMRKIEPFNTAISVVYKPEYLSGFVAERYSVGLKNAWADSQKRMKSELEADIHSVVRRRYHADRVENVHAFVSYNDVKFKYLMLPVWLSSFKYKDKIYNFMVNGQTGRVGGKIPLSAWKVALAVILGAAALIGLFYLFANGDINLYM